MSDESNVMHGYGRAVLEEARATRATRVEVVTEARLQRRRVRRLRDQALALRDCNLDLSWRLWSLMALPEPPSTLPLAWAFPPESEDQMENAISAAKECAAECIDAIRAGGRRERAAFATIAGVCSLAAEYGQASHPDSAAAMSLCVRVIESKTEDLDLAGSTVSGLLAASAARRCAQPCKRVLEALYPIEED
jgi:hypothetical protein